MAYTGSLYTPLPVLTMPYPGEPHPGEREYPLPNSAAPLRTTSHSFSSDIREEYELEQGVPKETSGAADREATNYFSPSAPGSVKSGPTSPPKRIKAQSWFRNSFRFSTPPLPAYEARASSDEAQAYMTMRDHKMAIILPTVGFLLLFSAAWT